MFGSDAGKGRVYFNIRNLENKDSELITGVGTTGLKLHLLALERRAVGEASAASIASASNFSFSTRSTRLPGPGCAARP